MNIFWEELSQGIPDGRELAHVLLRLISATALGMIVGIQRERAGKPAGLRTHMLVALGTALVVVACTSLEMSHDAQSRVIQGILTGIGFMGAGSILKLEKEHDIQGLTSAAGIWMTAAIGLAAGMGSLGVALIGSVLTWIILSLADIYESRGKEAEDKEKEIGGKREDAPGDK